MKKIFAFIIITIIISACTNNDKKLHESVFIKLTADKQTDAVADSDDAADDPAIWINPKNIAKSLIIGTNKQKGLNVYDIQGNELYSCNFGRINKKALPFPEGLN